ncbi:MAG: hypothetical protein N0E48_25365 [Candidatus Thiodiazotropha endolucinida]|nr:hypothetical protein [Candidatus Thiodiazotropha endolucinida]
MIPIRACLDVIAAGIGDLFNTQACSLKQNNHHRRRQRRPRPSHFTEGPRVDRAGGCQVGQ